ncbi:hypothetical protein TPL01_04080 [Sulfuriferula plumbiphila]|uniref:Uncharacterized protein n=1 Tax=Sulfuriferula plumbiphila TaxID=171865 RepID=A0A512L486_9PROT|nr:hypothetical protein SFPGR_28550 [Sulfuriferula plumbiphila]GEP29270.1 hypothetical protein TPL01_04080 [Sulfuriferula plumbiphila]
MQVGLVWQAAPHSPPQLAQAADSPVIKWRQAARLPQGCHARRAAFAVYDEESARNPAFREIHTEWKRLRDSEIQWFKVAEAPYRNSLHYVK